MCILQMCLFCVDSSDNNDRARYDNYRIYRLLLKTEEHVKIFQEIEERSDSYTFYGHARQVDQRLTIMVASQKIAEISEILSNYNIEHEILVSFVNFNLYKCSV